MLEVFADIGCPFAHAGLRLVDRFRRDRGLHLGIRVRPWPLELVNGRPTDPTFLGREIEAIRAGVGTDLFAGFDAERFPATTLPALAAEVAAYRAGPEIGERFSLAVRTALWEEGRDVSDPDLLRSVADAVGASPATSADDEAVVSGWEEGQARGVEGSPHFFAPGGGYFCPMLAITHEGDTFDVRLDPVGLERFLAALVAADDGDDGEPGGP
jgi:predicted DsbA family dithiol-disulfide isomerase